MKTEIACQPLGDGGVLPKLCHLQSTEINSSAAKWTADSGLRYSMAVISSNSITPPSYFKDHEWGKKTIESSQSHIQQVSQSF